ncbi:MAG: hypothetical protein K6E16_10650 [Lachnospiraceae bacterium]|nr:hypothetical protein [Lachnospiraceae bacterium]
MEQNLYFDELNTLEELSEEERIKRVEAVFRDKEAAVETIPLLYLKDVTDIAKLYEGQGVAADDLIGEGNVALLSGCANLDLCESAQEVEEFLTRTVMDAMEKLVGENADESEIDSRIAQKVNLVYEAAKELSETLLRKVSIEELAREMDADRSMIEEAVRLSGNRIDYIETGS